MVPDIVNDLESLGGLARLRHLADRGHSRASVRRLLDAGVIVRVCHGWVGLRTAPRAAVTAILLGGKVTGTTALASMGVWDGLDRRIHVHIPAHSHGRSHTALTPLSRFAAERFPREGVVRHWLSETYPDPWGPVWRVSTVDALIRAAHDVPEEQFIACVESALNTGALSRAALPELYAGLPRRLEHTRDSLEPRSESGLETTARLRFSTFVKKIEVQVWVDGIARGGGRGRVDQLLDDWLVIELDGDEFHDAAEDRRRIGALVRAGYRCHRFGYHDIIHSWEQTEATVRELLRYPPRG